MFVAPQLSPHLRTRHHDEVLCCAKHSGRPPNPLVAAYVEATNNFDLDRLMATFAEHALVNDQLRDYWGKPAVREWAIRDMIRERLTMNATKVINQPR
jgi:hypothetical protein